MTTCTPLECPYCWPWGDGVPGKTRCTRDLDDAGKERGWKFSTTLGSRCVLEKEGEQLSLFPMPRGM